MIAHRPQDPSPAGCITSILAIIALVLLPVISSTPVLSSGLLIGVAIGLSLVAVIGALVNVLGGGFVRGAVVSDVEEAVTQLIEAFPNGDARVMCEAAVRLFDGSIVSTGPVSVEGFDRHEVQRRLGDALPFVIAVERILLKRNEIYPCFTLDNE